VLPAPEGDLLAATPAAFKAQRGLRERGLAWYKARAVHKRRPRLDFFVSPGIARRAGRIHAVRMRRSQKWLDVPQGRAVRSSRKRVPSFPFFCVSL